MFFSGPSSLRREVAHVRLCAIGVPYADNCQGEASVLRESPGRQWRGRSGLALAVVPRTRCAAEPTPQFLRSPAGEGCAEIPYPPGIWNVLQEALLPEKGCQV